MSQYSDAQLRLLWRAAIPLSKAPVSLASDKQKTSWRELQSRSAMDAVQEGVRLAAAQDGNGPAKLQAAFGGAQEILNARQNLEAELRRNVLCRIAAGTLHGIGFEPPRTTASVPVSLPRGNWGTGCKWQAGQVTFESMDFVEVRLLTTAMRDDVLERDSLQSAEDRRRPGRPAIGPDLRAAFDALHASGEIDTSQPMRAHYDKVRRWLDQNRPTLHLRPDEISDEAIRRHISPLFKELREGKKQ